MSSLTPTDPPSCISQRTHTAGGQDVPHRVVDTLSCCFTPQTLQQLQPQTSNTVTNIKRQQENRRRRKSGLRSRSSDILHSCCWSSGHKGLERTQIQDTFQGRLWCVLYFFYVLMELHCGQKKDKEFLSYGIFFV